MTKKAEKLKILRVFHPIYTIIYATNLFRISVIHAK